jgi:DNA mismatch repair ATPase MutS
MPDYYTIRSLEIVRPLDDAFPHSTLFHAVDKTRTPMGKRLLKQKLLQPSIDLEAINASLNQIEALRQNPSMLDEIEVALKDLPDIDQLIASMICRKGTKGIEGFESKITRVISLRKILQTCVKLGGLFPTPAEDIPSYLNALRDGFVAESLAKINDLVDGDVVLGPKGSLQQHQKCYLIRNGQNALLDTARRTLSEITNDIYEYVEGLSSKLPLC